MCATIRSVLLVMIAAATLSACNNGPKNYDDCMLQASREGKNDRQFRKLAEECNAKFRSKE